MPLTDPATLAALTARIEELRSQGFHNWDLNSMNMTVSDLLALLADAARLRTLEQAIQHELEICICTVSEANQQAERCRRCKRLLARLSDPPTPTQESK